MFSMNQLYLVGGASTVALCIFLYMQSCRVTANFYINLTNLPPLLMVTLNQFYLIKGGPALHCIASFIYNRVG
jgi:hypothetical protein